MLMIHWFRRTVCIALFAVTLGFGLSYPTAAAATPVWPAGSVIYCVYPSIFSPERNFAGVTAQLGRLKALGVTTLWLMPVTPTGHAVNGHPAFGSPYAVQDYFAVNPDYGSDADLQVLVKAAHTLGIKVILDEVLNHTSWDNPLVTLHPEYYLHSDGNPKNPASIQQAFNFGDVAQLNYASANLRAYMTQMLQFWLIRYHVDGFRFDTASSPEGPGRMIPADFWQELGRNLRLTRPDVLMMGESESQDLALKPFALDYGWRLYNALKDAFNGGDASQVEAAWHRQTEDFPPSMKHLSLQDDWDDPRDLSAFNGAAGTMAAAVFNFTNTGIPLIYNGMEIGNAGGSVNPHTPIAWAGGDPRFLPFYREIIALRRRSPALQDGKMTWLPNSLPTQVLTYTRANGASEFLVEINLSESEAHGTVKAEAKSGWTEVRIGGARGVEPQAAPPQISLPPQGFALFQRSLPKR